MLVSAELENLELHHALVKLGEVEIKEELSAEKYDQLKVALYKWGLELMDSKRAILAEKIKTVIIEMIHCTNELPKVKYSEYLSEKLDHKYAYISNFFAKVKGTTLQHFILSHKIERVKELMVYEELTLSEIAWKLNYSSVAHLSNQFKKITGLRPSHFKNMKDKRLIALENL